MNRESMMGYIAHGGTVDTEKDNDKTTRCLKIILLLFVLITNSFSLRYLRASVRNII
jgi:hypothetical protein